MQAGGGGREGSLEGSCARRVQCWSTMMWTHPGVDTWHLPCEVFSKIHIARSQNTLKECS